MGSDNSKKNNKEKEEKNENLINLTSEVIIPRLRSDPNVDYEKITILGEGKFGKVYKVKHRITGQIRAIKEIKKSPNSSNEDDKKVLNEVSILQKLDNPNIIKIFEFYIGKNSYSLVNEICPSGDLFDEISKNGPFGEEYAAYVMYQILSGVNYCHKMQILHRDLKPENILILSKNSKNKFPSIKICDFGTSHFFDNDIVQNKTVDSINYLAPEVIKQNYNEKCDIWSCGVILYMLLTKKLLFRGNNREDIIDDIVKGKYNLDDQLIKKCSDECKNFLQNLLTYDPEKRINSEIALQDPFFKKYDTKKKYNEISDKNIVKNFIYNLKTYKKKSVIQETALAYLVHNFNQIRQIEMAGKLFNQFDNSKDGKINKEELYNALKSVIGDDGNLENEVDLIFKNIDSDNNKFIEYEEFIRAAIDKSMFMDEKVLRFAFRYFDKDNSNEIDFDEIKEIFEKNIKIDKKDLNVTQVLKQIIDEVDLNNDGKISFEEFEIIMKKLIN